MQAYTHFIRLVQWSHISVLPHSKFIRYTTM